ncbi:hypothetical protein [Spiroplasma endosymbiont of Cantharis nigra]|uniref:hypothetical protein n=1 Tax=Spiroplasma endosymbiont of Cantharis nigra TaxID=3066278 RepID=UPI0030D35D14
MQIFQKGNSSLFFAPAFAPAFAATWAQMGVTIAVGLKSKILYIKDKSCLLKLEQIKEVDLTIILLSKNKKLTHASLI